MNPTDLIKASLGSVARWAINWLIAKNLLNGTNAQQMIGEVTLFLTLAWTVGENWWVQRNLPKPTPPQPEPSGVPPVKLSSFILIACLFLSSGCASGIFTTKNLATLAKEAAYQGAKLEMQRDLSTRAAFEAGSEALKGLIASKDYDPDHFAAAIRALKIDELKSKEASIAVSGVVIIWSAYAPEITALDEEQKVLPIITAVQDGLARALAEIEKPKP